MAPTLLPFPLSLVSTPTGSSLSPVQATAALNPTSYCRVPQFRTVGVQHPTATPFAVILHQSSHATSPGVRMKEDTIIPPCHLVDLIIVCVNTQGGVLSNYPSPPLPSPYAPPPRTFSVRRRRCRRCRRRSLISSSPSSSRAHTDGRRRLRAAGGGRWRQGDGRCERPCRCRRPRRY